LTDISRHKREEAAITNLKEQLEIVLNSIDSIIYVSDMDTHEILYLNERAKMEFGQCIGEVCYKVLQSGYCEPCSFCTNDKLLDTSGQPIGVYSWDYQNSINNRWYHCQDVAIPWLDGRYVRLEIATDLTEKKVHERALQQANEKLNLLSGITRHDVLNQLTVLTNLIEMQQEMALDSKHMNLIAREKDSCETINHLIQFTREYEDLGMYDPRWMNLGECLTMYQGECQSLTIHYSPNIWNYAILGDPLISKVFYNLLDNTKRHGGSVQNVTYSVDQIQDNLILLYEDDGVGIPSDMKELIFEKGVGKNTGLGLFFCREVLALTEIAIREIGGGIHGARFELVVPKKSWRYTPHLS
jgi:signal transduction histidine kinase